MRAQRSYRKLKSKLRRNKANIAAIAFGVIFASGLFLASTPEPRSIDPAAYEALLDTIAKGESRGNYNAYFGHADNRKIQFTKMSVADVMKWQEKHVANGSVSSAVGKYQIIRPTLAGLVKQLKINTSLPFDESMQDRMAIALLERRGAEDYVNKKITREEFAHNLSKEWAALPKVLGADSKDSYYSGDGINKSNVSVPEVFSALAKLDNSTSIN